MVKINVSADCGNSPKKILLKDLNIAFAKGDIDFISAHISDEITWNTIGERVIRGKDAFIAAKEEMKDNPPLELTIDKVVTHGYDGAVNGEIVMQDGKRYAYCDVYEFKSVKAKQVASIQSYVIEIE